MNKEEIDKINCFSYSRRDLVILLMIFNTTYYFFVSLVRHDLMGCFITAVAAGLFVLLILTLRDVIKKLQDNICKLQYENMLLRKSIKDEYRKIYRLKRKYGLISRINNPDIDAEETLISCVDDPQINSPDDINFENKVHFEYLKGFCAYEESQSKKGNNPTG